MMKLRNNNGFSLLEVLVSISLLSIVILIFLSVFHRYALVSNINEDKIIAMNLAKKGLISIQEANDSNLIDDDFLYKKKTPFFDIDKHLVKGAPPLAISLVECNNECNNKQEIIFYKIENSEADYYMTIENITTIPDDKNEQDELKLFAITVKVYNNTLNKVLAENFGYLKKE